MVFVDCLGKGAYFAYLPTLDGVIASRGGMPMVVGGKVIGAIGVQRRAPARRTTRSAQAGVAAVK